MPGDAFSKYHFSADYQELLIACLLRHPDEFGGLAELVEARLFSGLEAFEVVAQLHDYRKKYAIYPDITTLGAHIQRNLAFQNPERAETTRVYLQKLAVRDTTHREHVKDSVREFACHTRIYRMIQDTGLALNQGTPPEQLDLISKVAECMKVMQAGEDMGIHVNKDWEKVVDGAGCIQGVFPGFDKFMSIWPDGWGPGWLIAVLAPSKRFKTTFCVNVAVNMALQPPPLGTAPIDVLYYACELNQVELTERILLSLTGLNRTDLRINKERFKLRARGDMGFMAGNILVKSYPSKGATIATMRAHAHQAIASFKLKPRAIIIDFAETVRPDSPPNTPDNRQQSDIYTQARAFGHEIGACVIMPDRANRETITAAVPKITGFQGAIEKAGISDIGIGLCQTDKEHQNGTMRYFIFINRHGPEFLHYQGKVDAETAYMTIETQIPYDPDQVDAQANGQPKPPKKFQGHRRPNTVMQEAAEHERQDAEAASQSYQAPNLEP